MRFRKGKEPSDLRRWRSRNPDERSWEALNAEVKGRMRAALSRDQGGACCYCYGPAEAGSRIEHIDARTAQNILAWDNLALACSGGEGLPPGDHHCDKKKADRSLDVVHPYRNPVIGLVKVVSNGRLKGYRDNESLRTDIEDVLGLDTRRLVNARKQAIATAAAGLPGRAWTAKRLGEVLDGLRSGGTPMPHQAWVEQWLAAKVASR